MYVNALGIPFLLVFATAVTGEHTFLQAGASATGLLGQSPDQLVI